MSQVPVSHSETGFTTRETPGIEQGGCRWGEIRRGSALQSITLSSCFWITFSLRRTVRSEQRTCVAISFWE